MEAESEPPFMPTREAEAELERLKKAKVGVRPDDGGRRGLVLLLSLSSACCCCPPPVRLSTASCSATATPRVRFLAFLVPVLLLLMLLLLLLLLLPLLLRCVGVTVPRTLGRPPLVASRPCRGLAPRGGERTRPVAGEEEKEARSLVVEEEREQGLRMVQGSWVVLGSS